jgi:YhcH/YjgK/YiaL family protein
MVQDTLENAGRYERLHPLLPQAFAFLRTVDGSLSLGRHDIDGERVFALVQKYTSKPQSEALFEAHRRYVDVQYVHAGRETILWAPLHTMRETTMPYDEAKEAALFKLTPDFTPLRLSAGHFAILFPEDAHAPCVHWENAEEVFKVVVKVAVAQDSV